MIPTVQQALQTGQHRLAGEPSARLEAEMLLCHVLGRDRAYLYTWPERGLEATQWDAYQALLARRAAGEPVAYLIGHRQFWSLDLRVTPATLIPRPETELLVEQALARIPPDAAWDVADLGTGSGAVALALARERPRCRVLATDRSAAALAVAQDNAQRHGIGTVRFRQGDWCEALGDERFELLVSNPPYVRRGDPHLDQGDARFEPRTALEAGADGLDAIRHLIACSLSHLAPGGWLLMEHGYDQGAQVCALLRAAGFDAVEDYRDLGGQPRVAAGRLAAANPTDALGNNHK